MLYCLIYSIPTVFYNLQEKFTNPALTEQDLVSLMDQYIADVAAGKKYWLRNSSTADESVSCL